MMETPLFTKQLKFLAPCVEFLLQYGADIDFQNENKETALFVTAKGRRDDIYPILLKNNANPNISQVDGMTPLMKAAMGLNLKLVQLLLENNANPNLLTPDGHSALSLAKFYKLQYHSLRHYAEIKAELVNSSPILKTHAKYAKYVKTLAHLCSVKGSTKFFNKTIERTGISGTFISLQLTKHFLNFAKQFPALISKKQVQGFIVSHSGHPPFQEPAFLNDGFMNHYVHLFFWKNRVFLSNRGAASEKSVEIFRTRDDFCFNTFKSNLSERIYSPESVFEDYWGKDLHQNFKPKQEDDIYLENLLALPQQTVGNCGWANREQGLLVFLAAYPKIEDIEENVENAKYVLNQFVTYFKFVYLDKYFQIVSTNPNLLEKNFIKQVLDTIKEPLEEPLREKLNNLRLKFEGKL